VSQNGRQYRSHPVYDLETKPAVVSAFIQFRLEFGETEILADRLVLLFLTVLLFGLLKKIEKDIIIMLPHAFCINRKKDIKSK
jgi:hypothetical protein